MKFLGLSTFLLVTCVWGRAQQTEHNPEKADEVLHDSLNLSPRPDNFNVEFVHNIEEPHPVGRSGQLQSGLSAEENARQYLQTLTVEASQQCFQSVVAEWNYATDLNPENERLQMEERVRASKFDKEVWKNVTSFNWHAFQDPDVKRQFKSLSVLGTAILSDEEFKKLNELSNTMEKHYSTTKICAHKDRFKCDLNLEPEIREIMRSSRSYDELEHVWTEWHDKSGKAVRETYKEFIDLSNKAYRLNNFTDTGDYWLSIYETKNFRDQVEHVWQQMKPFYEQLHAYMRSKLRNLYGEDKIPRNAPIPAHLLGNMWAQQWNNLGPDTVPFKGKQAVDVSKTMNEQGYTPLKMFKKSEEFFTSLGLLPMTDAFWQNSVLEKIPNREMVCHASAWDFCNPPDFRIKQCTVVTMEDLITAHHEMGHIQYYQQYAHQPKPYREGANPGFHEAVGDTLALSVATPKHLKEIGLLTELVEDNENDINFLYSMSLEKIAFMPFAYLMDLWRWDVFAGNVSTEEWNCHWWKLRENYQGVKSPVLRSEEHFDPAAKYHIAGNVEYLRYYLSTVYQFQFHKALCLAANQYDPTDPTKPLHRCDIYKSKAAGEKLAKMLKMGSSRPWEEAMEAITGQPNLDASAIREYFRPLELWLQEENRKSGETVGWVADGSSCKKGAITSAGLDPTTVALTDAKKEIVKDGKGSASSSSYSTGLFFVAICVSFLYY